MADGYLRQRQWYQDKSASKEVTALSSSVIPIIICHSQCQIFMQRIKIVVASAQAGATWDVQDSVTGQSLLPGGALSVATTAGTEADYGAFGLAITPLANVNLVITGTGATGGVTIDAYQRLRTDGTPIVP